MTQKENLIMITIEECSELQKSLSKMLRFGEKDHAPGTCDINEEDVWEEYLHVQAMMEELMDYGIINLSETKFSNLETHNIAKNDKKKQVSKYAYYSFMAGILKTDRICGNCKTYKNGECFNQCSINFKELLPSDYPSCSLWTLENRIRQNLSDKEIDFVNNIKTWIKNGIEKAKGENGTICILEEYELPQKDLPEYVSAVSAGAEKPELLVIDSFPQKFDEGISYVCGVAIDKDNIGMEKILKTPYTKQMEKAGDFYVVSIQKDKIASFKKEVINNLEKLSAPFKESNVLNNTVTEEKDLFTGCSPREKNETLKGCNVSDSLNVVPKSKNTDTKYEKESEKVAERAKQSKANIAILRDNKIETKKFMNFSKAVSEIADKPVIILRDIPQSEKEIFECLFKNTSFLDRKDVPKNELMLGVGVNKNDIDVDTALQKDCILYSEKYEEILIFIISKSSFDYFKLKTIMNDFVLNTLMKDMTDNNEYSIEEKEDCIERLNNKVLEEINKKIGLDSNEFNQVYNDIIILSAILPTRKRFQKAWDILHQDIVFNDFNTPKFMELKAISDKYIKNRQALGV